MMVKCKLVELIVMESRQNPNIKQPRVWERGASKGRKNSTNARQMHQHGGFQADPMMSQLQKSLIAETINGARASLNEPSRPFTPGDMPRHLFQGDDYSNRPGSSYKINNVVAQAADEFQKSHRYNQTGMSGEKQKVQTTEDVLTIMDRVPKSKQPAFSHLPVVGKPLKGKPIPVPLQPKNQLELQKQKSQGESDQLSSLVKGMSEEARKQEARKFDIQKQDNLQMMQKITTQLQQSKQVQSDSEEDLADELDDYMEQSLMQEANQLGIFKHQDADKQIQNLQNIQIKTDKPNRVEVREDEDDYDRLGDDLMANLESQLEQQSSSSSYVQEYEEVVEQISKICAQITQLQKNPSGKPIDENQIQSLCPRIIQLAHNHKTISVEDQEQCFLQTLLKGCFSLLAIKTPEAALKVSACNLQVFLQYFQSLTRSKVDDQMRKDFAKQFNFLYETVRGLLIYAKEGKFDTLFAQEKIVNYLGPVIQQCFLEYQDRVTDLLTTVVAGKEIRNDDKLFDFLNYAIGSLKCFTQTNKLVQEEAIQSRIIPILARVVEKVLYSSSMQGQKKAMLLVQVTGALRNLANVDSAQVEISQRIVRMLCDIFFDPLYNQGKELVLNIARLLSKVSLDYQCSQQMVDSGQLVKFSQAMHTTHKDHSAVLIRIAYILGNLTTNFEEARQQLMTSQSQALANLIELAAYYFEKDLNPQACQPAKVKGKSAKYEEFTQSGIEDALTKVMKLIANLSTDEEFAYRDLHKMTKQLPNFFGVMLLSVANRQENQTQQTEEFILNAISCTTNILFYDAVKDPIIEKETRVKIFKTYHPYLLYTQNEEIQIESCRVLSNLSRHQDLCDLFLEDNTFLKTVSVVLDHNLRDLVYYTVGVIINISLYGKQITNLLTADQSILDKLFDVLKDSNLEDMDLARVSAKALNNLQKVPDATKYWTESLCARLGELARSLVDDLDGIMEVATEEEAVEITALRDTLNACLNEMPEMMKECPVEGCGRKFKNQADLEGHVSRRHPQ